jgi:hypothetical protein
MIKKRIPLCILLTFLNAALFAASAEGDWYISNGSGMLLEKTYKTRALRSSYAVSLQHIRPEDVPAQIGKFYSAPWKIERRILYEDAKRFRTQWVYRDADNNSLFLAVIGNDGSGFLEWYDDKGYVVEEQRLASDGSGFFVSYTYKDKYLLKAEAHTVESTIKPKVEKLAEEEPKAEEPKAEEIKDEAPAQEPNDDQAAAEALAAAESDALAQAKAEEERQARRDAINLIKNPQGPAPIPEFFVAVTGRESGRLWTDDYRYTRTNTLRAIERKYFDKGAAKDQERLLFPRFVFKSQSDNEFVAPGLSLSANFLFADALGKTSSQITYTLDSKQRILTETRRDENGEVIGELTNTWINDRIEKMAWKTKTDERIVELEHDKKGNRVGERDYRNGVLERTVRMDGTKELEELYVNGAPILRAVWEDGVKISEERIAER